jgi:RNA polymerase sigma-70 factor (ECF subfamily)
MRLARSLTGHSQEAEDLVQDTYIKALLHWEQYAPDTNIRAWLCMILRNQFYSKKRLSWRMTPLDQEMAEQTIVDLAVNQEEQLGFNQEFALYAPLLGLVSLDMRDSVLAVHYLGMKYEEIALVLDIEVGTVKSRVSRGLTALQAILASDEKYALDLSPWEHASQDVPRDHPYYSIAKAYEEIYAFLKTQKKREFLRIKETGCMSRVDVLWREMIASEEFRFGDEEDLDSLMRS